MLPSLARLARLAPGRDQLRKRDADTSLGPEHLHRTANLPAASHQLTVQTGLDGSHGSPVEVAIDQLHVCGRSDTL